MKAVDLSGRERIKLCVVQGVFGTVPMRWDFSGQPFLPV